MVKPATKKKDSFQFPYIGKCNPTMDESAQKERLRKERHELIGGQYGLPHVVCHRMSGDSEQKSTSGEKHVRI